MNLLMILGLAICGFALLYFGAEWLVSGATRLADTLNIPKSIVGLTLVALGTSAPEMIVNLLAASRGHAGFALANVSGSNLTNLCVGFGLCGILATVSVKPREFNRDLFYFAACPVIVLLLLMVPPAFKLAVWSVIPLSILAAFFLASIIRRRNNHDSEGPTDQQLWTGIGLFLLGGLLLYGGGELVLNSSLRIADLLHVSDAVVGLTIVAMGTSIPDITASVVAARRGENGIAVGNLLGSNISNILVVLNGSLIVGGKGLAADSGIALDYTVVVVLSTVFAILYSRMLRVPFSLAVGLLTTYTIYLTTRVTFEFTH